MAAREAVRRSARGPIVELLALSRYLREPGLWLLIGLLPALGSLAYALPWRWQLDVGGAPPRAALCAALDVFDAPFLEGFNIDPEFDRLPPECAAARVAYRWAFDQAALRLPGVGRGVFNLRLRLARGQATTVASRWQLNGQPLLALPIAPEARTYELLLPPGAAADLTLRLQTPPFTPPGDSRPLAFAVDYLALHALTPLVPSPTHLGWLAASVALSYLLLRRWDLPARLGLLSGLALVALLALLLVVQRLNLTIYAPRLAVLLLLAYPLTVALQGLGAALARLMGLVLPPGEARTLAAIVALAWLVRALPLFHPQTFMSDPGLHANNLHFLIRGEVLFTEDLPARAGGGPAPYPPAFYVLLAPLALVVSEERTLVIAGAALADSLTILWLWLWLRCLGAGRPAALGAAAVYLFATPLLRSLQIGELANVWGQAQVAPVLLALTLWRQGRLPARVLTPLLALALLGHFGVFLSLLALGAAYLSLLLLRDPFRALRLAALGGAALLIVVALYYSAFVEVLLQRAPAPPPASSVAQRLLRAARELILPAGSVGLVASLLSWGGLVLAWRRWPALGELLLAWWLAVLLSWATLLISAQALRWEAFVFPAVALSGGVALAWFWQRNGWGRVLALALTVLLLAQGAWHWLEHLRTYR